MQAPSSRFRREGPFERIARAFPSDGPFGGVRRMLKPLFEQAIGWGTRGRVASRFPGGEVVRLRPRWRHLSWNPDEYAAFRSAVRPGDVVIDAGANVGGYALLFAQWVGPAGRVYAFEPDPRAFEALVDHISLNALVDRICPVHAAVTDVTGTAGLRLASASGLSRVSCGADGEPDLTVQSVSIDDFCAREALRPSFIKVDVEGAELAVLRGARRTIGAIGSELRLFVEMHPAAWPAFGYRCEDIVQECTRAGLTPEHLDGSRSGLWDVEGVCLRLEPVDDSR